MLPSWLNCALCYDSLLYDKIYPLLDSFTVIHTIVHYCNP